MNKDVYIENRSRFMETIEDNSVAILFAGKSAKKTGDELYEFTPNRNFYYLTGIQEEEHIVVLSKAKEVSRGKIIFKGFRFSKLKCGMERL